jgi:hypothetical protein
MIKGLLNNVLVDAWCLNKGGLNLYLIHPFLLRSKKLGKKNTHTARESKTGFWSALLLTQHHHQQAGGRNGHWETGQLAPQGNAIWQQIGKYYGGKHVWYDDLNTYVRIGLRSPVRVYVKSACKRKDGSWIRCRLVNRNRNRTARKPQHRLPSRPFSGYAGFSYLLPRRRNLIDRVTTLVPKPPTIIDPASIPFINSK